MHAERVVRWCQPGLPPGSIRYPALKVPGYFRVVPLGRKDRSGYEILSAPRKGQHENSPALQCRESRRCEYSPGGTAEMKVCNSAVPPGLSFRSIRYPALKVPGYFRVVPLGRKGNARHQGQEKFLTDRKSTRLNSSHLDLSRMPSSA